MFDFIEQGVVSARDTDFTARLTAQRSRRADLGQEITLVERQLSVTDHRFPPKAIERLGDVILRTLRSDDTILRQGYARRFIDRVVVAPGTITISGPIKPLEIAASNDPTGKHPWCPPLIGSGAPCTTRAGTQIIGKF